MKKMMKELYSALSTSDPQASFGVLFWDGEQLNNGQNNPRVVIGFKNQKAAKLYADR